MALNLRGKKTSLDEGASIYAKRNESESEKSKWNRMTSKEKWVHFKTYYMRGVLLGVFVVAIIGFFIYKDVIMKKDLVYRSAIINEGMMEMPLTEFSENYLKFMGLDPEKNIASFQLYYTTTEMANQVGATAASDLTQLSALIYASDLDSMIAGEEDFSAYLENGFFTDLSSILTEEEMRIIQDSLYIPDQKQNPEGKAYGVYLDQCEVYQEVFRDGGGIVERPICGMILNSARKEQSKKLLYYLFPQLQQGQK